MIIILMIPIFSPSCTGEIVVERSFSGQGSDRTK